MKTLCFIIMCCISYIVFAELPPPESCTPQTITYVQFLDAEVYCDGLLVATAKTVGELQTTEAKPQYIEKVTSDTIDGVPPFWVKYKTKVDDGSWSSDTINVFSESETCIIYTINWVNLVNLTNLDGPHEKQITISFNEIPGDVVTPARDANINYELVGKTDNLLSDYNHGEDDITDQMNSPQFVYRVWNRSDKAGKDASSYTNKHIDDAHEMIYEICFTKKKVK